MNMYNVSGYNLGTYIDEAEMDASTLVYESAPLGAFAGSTHFDSSGTIYLIYTIEAAGLDEHYFTYWNGTGWEPPDNICDVNRWSSTPDFIVYSSTNITAFLTEGEDMTRWSWDGDSWSKEETILAAVGSKDLAMGYLVSPYGVQPQDDFQITFCEWYNGYDLKGWGWGDNGLINDYWDDLDWYEVDWDVITGLTQKFLFESFTFLEDILRTATAVRTFFDSFAVSEICTPTKNPGATDYEKYLFDTFVFSDTFSCAVTMTRAFWEAWAAYHNIPVELPTADGSAGGLDLVTQYDSSFFFLGTFALVGVCAVVLLNMPEDLKLDTMFVFVVVIGLVVLGLWLLGVIP